MRIIPDDVYEKRFAGHMMEYKVAAQFEAAITAYCRETSPSYNPRSEGQADLGPITHGKPPQKGMNNMEQGTTEGSYSM